MAIFKLAGDSATFVWGADPTTDDSKPEAWGGWYYANGQPEGCTRVTVQAVSEDHAAEIHESSEAAWRHGVVSIDGDAANAEAWPPVFRRAVANLVSAVSSGLVSLVPPGA